MQTIKFECAQSWPHNNRVNDRIPPSPSPTLVEFIRRTLIYFIVITGWLKSSLMLPSESMRVAYVLFHSPLPPPPFTYAYRIVYTCRQLMTIFNIIWKRDRSRTVRRNNAAALSSTGWTRDGTGTRFDDLLRDLFRATRAKTPSLHPRKVFSS